MGDAEDMDMLMDMDMKMDIREDIFIVRIILNGTDADAKGETRKNTIGGETDATDAIKV